MKDIEKGQVDRTRKGHEHVSPSKAHYGWDKQDNQDTGQGDLIISMRHVS